MGKHFKKIALLLSCVGFLLAVPQVRATPNLQLPIVIIKNPSAYLGMNKMAEANTVLSILERNHHVTRGFVCTSANDIVAIDGLHNDPIAGYWAIYVNGNYKDYNSMSIVKPEDRVEVKFQPPSSYIEK